MSYGALSSLEDVIAILKSVGSLETLCIHFFFCLYIMLLKRMIFGFSICNQDTSIDPSEVFNRIISSICILLTKDEVRGCLC